MAVLAGTWILLDRRAAFIALVAVIVIGGSEQYLGPIRLIDSVAVLGLLGVASDQRAWQDVKRPGLPQALIVSAMALSVVVALARGTPFSSSHTDVHDGFLLIAVYVIVVCALPRLDADTMITIVIVAAVLASIKAIALELLAGGSALGATSILQASVIQTAAGTKRVVLIGGDTVIALAPALCIVARRLPVLRPRRWVAAFVITSLATAVSVTRTNVIAAAVAIVLAVMLEGFSTGWNVDFRRLAVALTSAVAVLMVAAFVVNPSGKGIGQGIANRFASRSDIAYSLQYRGNEDARLMSTLKGHELVGLGAGATFFTAIPVTAGGSTVTTQGETLWAHNGYLWIVLKSGIAGLLLFVAAMMVAVRWLVSGPRALLGRVGLVSLLGVLALSYTTNRFDDPGAALLMAIALAAVSTLRVCLTTGAASGLGMVSGAGDSTLDGHGRTVPHSQVVRQQDG